MSEIILPKSVEDLTDDEFIKKYGDDKFRYYKRRGDQTVALHESYDPWLEDMKNRKGNLLEPIEFNLKKHPEQNIFVSKIDARDPYWYLPDALYYHFFNKKMERSLGKQDYYRLLEQFNEHPTSSDDPTPLHDRLIKNHIEGRNTMIVSSHITFHELGYIAGIMHRGKENRHNISQNGVLYNKLMTRQSYKGRPLTDQFSPISNIYLSSPKSSSAIKYGVPQDAAMIVNALFLKDLNTDLDNGGLELQAALTGKQIEQIMNDNGELTNYNITNIDPASANLIKGFDDIIGITLMMSPITNQWEMKIGELIDIKEELKNNSPAEIVDSLYENIAMAIQDLTHKDVTYCKLAPELAKRAIAKSQQILNADR